MSTGEHSRKVGDSAAKTHHPPSDLAVLTTCSDVRDTSQGISASGNEIQGIDLDPHVPFFVKADPFLDRLCQCTAESHPASMDRAQLFGQLRVALAIQPA